MRCKCETDESESEATNLFEKGKANLICEPKSRLCSQEKHRREESCRSCESQHGSASSERGESSECVVVSGAVSKWRMIWNVSRGWTRGKATRHPHPHTHTHTHTE
jgi:hypothetical protein